MWIFELVSGLLRLFIMAIGVICTSQLRKRDPANHCLAGKGQGRE
jgi:hypothetical protein